MDLSGSFGPGLVLGILIGYLAGPMIRAWLARRSWIEASRELEARERETLEALAAQLQLQDVEGVPTNGARGLPSTPPRRRPEHSP